MYGHLTLGEEVMRASLSKQSAGVQTSWIPEDHSNVISQHSLKEQTQHLELLLSAAEAEKEALGERIAFLEDQVATIMHLTPLRSTTISQLSEVLDDGEKDFPYQQN